MVMPDMAAVVQGGYHARMAERAGVQSHTSGEVLSWDEIRRRYPDEWVVLVDSDWTNMVTTSGVVYAHARDKKTAYELARGLREVAIFWTGELHNPELAALLHHVDRRV